MSIKDLIDDKLGTQLPTPDPFAGLPPQDYEPQPRQSQTRGADRGSMFGTMCGCGCGFLVAGFILACIVRIILL